MNKIKASIPRLSNLLRILFILIVIRGGFGLLEGGFGIYKLLTDPEAALSGYMALTSGFLELSAETGFGINFGTALSMGLVRVASTLLTTTVLCLGIRSLLRILDFLSFGLPFHAKVSGELHRMAILATVYSFIDAFLCLVTNVTLTRGYHIDATLSNGEPLSVSFHNLPYYPYLILVIALFFLSWIFRYGEELQTLSDETL